MNVPGVVRVGLLPGDGIGAEVVGAAETVLNALRPSLRQPVEVVRFPHGAQHLLDTGELLSESSLEAILGCRAVLFGAAGDPRLPAGTMERALIVDLGRRAGLSLGIRPLKLFADRLSPLRDPKPLDVLIVRDLAEGETALPGGSINPGAGHEVAASLIVHTRAAVDATLHHGFRLAAGRRRRVAVVAQANSVGAHRIWHQRAVEVARAHPDVEAELLYPDAAGMDLIRRPESFDVMVTPLLIGGILTDVGAALIGGMGLVGSSRVNPATGFAVFEPAHGSAPRHAGARRVCPLATILALAMLLEHVGEPDGAARVHAAVAGALGKGDHVDVTTSTPGNLDRTTGAVVRRLG